MLIYQYLSFLINTGLTMFSQQDIKRRGFLLPSSSVVTFTTVSFSNLTMKSIVYLSTSSNPLIISLMGGSGEQKFVFFFDFSFGLIVSFFIYLSQSTIVFFFGDYFLILFTFFLGFFGECSEGFFFWGNDGLTFYQSIIFSGYFFRSNTLIHIGNVCPGINTS